MAASSSLEIKKPEDLHQAFQLFNEISEELVGSYRDLEDKVQHLSDEVEQVNQKRLKELAEKERLADRLKNLLRILPGGVVVLDSKGVVSEANQAAVDLLGEPLLGEKWLKIIKRSFAPKEDDGHEISLRDGRRISMSTRSLEAEPGQVILLTDQTETRKLQQNLSRHQRLSSLGKMVSSLAHQIRTPLSAAMLYGGHLSSELSPDQTRKFSHKLMSRLNNIERQIKDMLVFAKGESLLEDQLESGEFLAALKSATETIFKQPGVKCEWLNSAAGEAFRCNQETLIGAVLNLVNNAVQASAQVADPKIKIVLEKHHDSHLKLYVEDKGPGFDNKLKEKLMEPFFTTKAQGTGLGLSVAKVVAKAHRGEFWIESEKAIGTKAGFLIPLVKTGEKHD